MMAMEGNEPVTSPGKKKIVYARPFDPTLCDGVSSSMFDLLSFQQNLGHEVFIISFMHDTDLCRSSLKHSLDYLKTKIITQDKHYCHFILNKIPVYYELLPYSRVQILGNHPKVLQKYINKIKEFDNFHLFTVDFDTTCLLANSIINTSSLF